MDAGHASRKEKLIFMSERVRFTKMHGAGNDYIYVYVPENHIADPEKCSIEWSKPHFGIGSDGLVLICPSDKGDFKMRIFNADGSEAYMCGNASRCIGKYLYEEGFTSTSLIAEKSFCYTEVYTLTGKPNIQIEYLIPAGSDDGVALLDEALSYSPNQEEFLIKNSSLFKVLDVKVDSTNNVAFLQVMLIPERIWDYPDYEKEKQDIQTRK